MNTTAANQDGFFGYIIVDKGRYIELNIIGEYLLNLTDLKMIIKQCVDENKCLLITKFVESCRFVGNYIEHVFNTVDRDYKFDALGLVFNEPILSDEVIGAPTVGYGPSCSQFMVLLDVRPADLDAYFTDDTSNCSVGAYKFGLAFHMIQIKAIQQSIAEMEDEEAHKEINDDNTK
jgi:hypothetical protein